MFARAVVLAFEKRIMEHSRRTVFYIIIPQLSIRGLFASEPNREGSISTEKFMHLSVSDRGRRSGILRVCLEEMRWLGHKSL